MEQRKRSSRIINLLLAVVALGLVGLLTEGCAGKKCGCVADLNGVYKTRRHR